MIAILEFHGFKKCITLPASPIYEPRLRTIKQPLLEHVTFVEGELDNQTIKVLEFEFIGIASDYGVEAAVYKFSGENL